MTVETPICDFVRAYAAARPHRLHMPGHKGTGDLGCESWDVTEVKGADSLYEAEGIIAQSERNAAALFGSGRTLYSTEGSSQCIRAMLALALTCRGSGRSSTVVAARNVHRSFVYACGLLDAQPLWLTEEDGRSLCTCRVSPAALEETLRGLPQPPAAVYVTSPDYLGVQQDIAALAAVCRRCDTLLLVDNAHGAYLHFLEPPCHPMDLGADLCCDSAHKTLPVLTGGAYLHLSASLPRRFFDQAKPAMSMFGSTSPSYLTLTSLDLCNRTLSGDYRSRLKETIGRLDALRSRLAGEGWAVGDSDPLKLTLRCSERGWSGVEAAERLRREGIECEFADKDDLVCMFTPSNPPEDAERLEEALSDLPIRPACPGPALPRLRPESVCSIREALLAPQETVPPEQSLGRVCGAPTVSCPPAIPIAVSGERITAETVEWMRYYGLREVRVLA